MNYLWKIKDLDRTGLSSYQTNIKISLYKMINCKEIHGSISVVDELK